MLKTGLMLAGLLGTGALAQDHWNWGNDDTTAPSGFDFTRSHAICRRLGHPVAPLADRPTPAQARALKGCNSEALYYAPGGKPDYVKARLCAMTEDDGDNPGEVFQGTTIVMQVYANGRGVARNLDLATAYACELDAAAFESHGRVMHLQALKTKPEPHPFDYCDDVTSGVHESICAARESEKAALTRDARIKALTDRLPPSTAARYREMRKALDAFIEAMVDGEVSHGGTAHAEVEIDAEDAVRDQFLRDLTRLLNGTWPAASAAQAIAADAQLNATYRAALASVPDNGDTASEPVPEGVRAAQRLWLAYRDAYLRFAAVAAPAVSRDSILTRLTNLRIAQLEEL